VAAQLLEDLAQRLSSLSAWKWCAAGTVAAVAVTLGWLVVNGARALRSTDAAVRKIHQQQANIIGMLLKAGFRPVSSKDWFDDGDHTRQIGDPAYTQFDWKPPSE
jgi:hypothetical protein